MIRLLGLCIAVALLLSGAACCPHIKPPTTRYYTGQTSSIYEVVEQINANNRPITTLYADHHFRFFTHDAKDHVQTIDGDGQLFFRKHATKPDDLLLTGENVALGPVFEIGSNSGPSAQFWVALIPKVHKEWWGYYRNIDKPCLDPKPPIRPDLVTEVLGVSDIPDNLLQSPATTMRFDNYEDAYVFAWIEQLRDRLIIRKEIWYDRQTFLPMRVILYDENGRALIRATLTNHEPVAGTDRIKIARNFQLEFPDTRDLLYMTLYAPRLSKKGRAGTTVPSNAVFKMRDMSDPQLQKIQIDQNCP
jgi:hypothetical protein